MALVAAVLAVVSGAAADIDGATASRWTPQPAWVGEARATAFGVSASDGMLVFEAEGAGKAMSFTLDLNEDETAGDHPYLVMEYRAQGVTAAPGDYLLHGVEGTPGGRTYIPSDAVRPDGATHTLVVDLPAIRVVEPTVRLAVKVSVGAEGRAALAVRRLAFVDEAPEGAEIVGTPVRAVAPVVLHWLDLADIHMEPGWLTNPADEAGMSVEEDVATFSVRGAGRGMRFPTDLPAPLDLAQTPYLSLRYRSSGRPSLTGYAIWLGDQSSGEGGQACIAVAPSDLVADGRWHTFTTRIAVPFTATQLAIGLDADGDEAGLAVGPLTFSAEPGSFPLSAVLPYQPLRARWPAGQDGWTVLPATVPDARPSPFLRPRLRLLDWFSTPNVTVLGVPFSVPMDPATIPQSGTTELGTLSLAVPDDAAEVCLLTATTAPPTEPFGIDSAHPRPVAALDHPEKVALEIRYADGPSDWVLPLNAESGDWGMTRGPGVHVVHPDPNRRPRGIVLHDRMQTAAFAIVAATYRTDAPRFPEPPFDVMGYSSTPAGGLAGAQRTDAIHPAAGRISSGALTAAFDATAGLRWSALSVLGLPESLACADGAVFEVEVAGQLLPADEWRLLESREQEGGLHFTLQHDVTGLRAEVQCLGGAPDAVRLRMRLSNTSAAPVTATLRFPVLEGIRIGPAAETWYLSGHRGGIIDSDGAVYRDPLGEPHPLQMDGFFNPRLGVALACLTHDTQAKHHWINLSKSADGGAWSPEYVSRDLAPGETFAATEAELAVLEGDWRAVFDHYREWLVTWFRPHAAEGSRFAKTIAFMARNASYDTSPDPKERGGLQTVIDAGMKHIGLCDYVHLFGWSASKRYGDCGDYNHYDETVGGLDYFRGSIARAQESGIAVGLYQDGYISSADGEVVGAHAEEWAMRRADGSPCYIPEFRAYNECPYMPGWQDHLAATFKRLAEELRPDGLYIDEYGATDARWLCQAKDHGHNGYEVPYAGEVAMIRRLREAVGPDIALYTEYPPAEVSRQYLDGSFSYQALFSVDEERVAPHFIDLPRFAFPAFRQFHIIHYVAPRAGNWWLLKFPFFNGECYFTGEPNLPGYDAAALAFQRRAIEVLSAHRDAFTSSRVTPLVPTEQPGVFANRFDAEDETVWTLYNANGRSVRGAVLRVPEVEGATYEDAWTGEPITPVAQNGSVLLPLELGPKAVGCIVQRHS